MAHKIKFGNGVWANQEGSTLAYNDENNNYKPLPFKVTRASIGTRVNKQGLVEVVGHDTLRIDYTDSDKGVALLEPSRTNLETKSNGFITWSSNSNITRTADYITSPDGTQNATRLQFTANGFCSNKTQALATYTMSCYAKRNDSGTQNVGFFTNGSGVVNSAWAITSEWKRFSYSFPALNGGAMGIAGVSGADISVYGFQIEGLASYPTSYIPTNGSAVTREADLVNGSGNSAVINDSEGVLFANYKPTFADGSRQITVNNGSYNDRIVLECRENGTKLRSQISDGGVSVMEITSVIPSINLYYKCAIKYKANNGAFWINGFKIGEDTSMSVPSGLNNVSFSGKNDNSLIMTGNTKEVGYYDTALTDAELEYMTSYRNWESMVNELNLNIIYNG